MVERRPLLDVLTHLVLVLGVLLIAFPLYVTFIASTHLYQPMTKDKKGFTLFS